MKETYDISDHKPIYKSINFLNFSNYN